MKPHFITASLVLLNFICFAACTGGPITAVRTYVQSDISDLATYKGVSNYAVPVSCSEWVRCPTNWIWYSTLPESIGFAIFTKSFNVIGNVKKAELDMSVDNALNAFNINGMKANVDPSVTYWFLATSDVTSLLKSGRNVLSINVTNFEGPGGICYQIRIDSQTS